MVRVPLGVALTLLLDQENSSFCLEDIWFTHMIENRPSETERGDKQMGAFRLNLITVWTYVNKYSAQTVESPRHETQHRKTSSTQWYKKQKTKKAVVNDYLEMMFFFLLTACSTSVTFFSLFSLAVMWNRGTVSGHTIPVILTNRIRN